MIPYQLNEKIRLDLYQENDAEYLFQLICKNRTYLREFLSWLDHSNSIEDIQAFIQKTTIENQEKKALTLSIREDKRIIGTICFHPFDRLNNSAKIGYWLDQENQGKGVITQACKYLINLGFTHFSLDTIKISCGISNAKSQAVAERLGFTHKVFIPQNEWLYDHYVDHYCYSISAEEWLAFQTESS